MQYISTIVREVFFSLLALESRDMFGALFDQIEMTTNNDLKKAPVGKGLCAGTHVSRP